MYGNIEGNNPQRPQSVPRDPLHLDGGRGAAAPGAKRHHNLPLRGKGAQDLRRYRNKNFACPPRPINRAGRGPRGVLTTPLGTLTDAWTLPLAYFDTNLNPRPALASLFFLVLHLLPGLVRIVLRHRTGNFPGFLP